MNLSDTEFDYILQNGESYYVEFKERVNSVLSREIIAFANASGGKIYLGVNDQGETVGIEISNKREINPKVRGKSSGKRRVSVGKASGKCRVSVSKSSGMILDACRETASITITEMSEKIGITERSIQRNIQKLQADGFLRRVGGRKEGYWEVVDDE